MSLKISEFPTVSTPLSGTEVIPVVQSGDNKKITVANLAPQTSCQLLGKLISADFSRMKVTYDNKTAPGTPLVGTFTDTTSAAVGMFIPNTEVDNNDGTGSIVVGFINGAISDNDFFDDGTTTAQVNGSLTPADQLITLSGGSTFIITDIIITNAGATLNPAANGEIHPSPSRVGSLIGKTNQSSELLNSLTTPDKYINNYIGMKINNSFQGLVQDAVTVGNNIYFSLGTPKGVPVVADIYVFGFVLN